MMKLKRSFVARCAAVAGVLASLLGLAGCQSPGPLAAQAPLPSVTGGDFVLPVASLRQTRLASTLLQQYDFSCGSAAVATLLTHHFGLPVTEREIFERMYEQGDQAKIQREGFSLLDLKRGLASYGLQADGFEQPLEKLLQARLPAIVLIAENGYQHFVVVKGLSPERVLIGDPASGTRAMTRSAFDAVWQNRLLLVVHNRPDLARFNLAADWRAAPQSPLAAGLSRDSLSSVTMPKHGPGDF
jgi:predicted double-glycine peptidase